MQNELTFLPCLTLSCSGRPWTTYKQPYAVSEHCVATEKSHSNFQIFLSEQVHFFEEIILITGCFFQPL